MDLNSALDIIIKDLRDAREIINDLSNYKDVPLIQVELAKSKCKSAEEIISILKTILPTDMDQSTATASASTSTPSPSTTPGSATAPVPSPAENDEHKQPEPDKKTEKNDETLTEIKSEVPDKPQIVSPVSSKKEKMRDTNTGKQIIADRFGERESRVNEKMLGNRTDDDISSKINQSPISNLPEAIGINDRFYFIREIFGGNKEAYSSAINKLNTVSGLKEAEDIINTYRSGNTDTDAVDKLLGLVKRKTL